MEVTKSETKNESGTQEDPVLIKKQVYKDPRPKEFFDRFHERSRTRQPDAVYEAVRSISTMIAYVAYRARCIGAYNVPASGSVILAPNHFSFMDHFFTGMFIRRRVRFMSKSQLFRRGLQWIFTHGGVFPVRRGHRDEEAFTTAKIILEKGGAIVMYCEGGRSRTQNLAPQAKPGIGRLALENGAPVVPVAIYGAAKVRNWKRFYFPSVTVQYGKPISFPKEENPSRERQQEVADEIFAAIRALYDDLEKYGTKEVRKRVKASERALEKDRRQK